MTDKRETTSKTELDARSRELIAKTLDRLRDLRRMPSHANGISGYPAPARRPNPSTGSK
jgi:hypothetical protein